MQRNMLNCFENEIKKYIYDERHTDYLKWCLALERKRRKLTDLYSEDLIPKSELKSSVEKINVEIQNFKHQTENMTEDLSECHDDVLEVIDYLRDFSRFYF